MKAIFVKEQDYFHLVQNHSDAPALHQAVLHGAVDAVIMLLRQKRPDVATVVSVVVQRYEMCHLFRGKHEAIYTTIRSS
jgi:hypothetical protein